MSKLPTTYLYFAYGSNLLTQRLRLGTPTAIRHDIGKLKDYRLDFDRCSSRWGGCSATIVPHPGKHVWGAIWEIERSKIDDLDKQEGVHDNIYFPLDVNVETPNGKVIECRVYQLINVPTKVYDLPLLPSERKPSRIYLETILQGAIESKLPDDYIETLKGIPHNGFTGPISVPGLNIDLTVTKAEVTA